LQDFKELTVWQKAHTFTLGVYRFTKSFPKEKTYGLTSQLRRSSVSIAANIAEGCGRRTDADFARFLQNAFGSATEAEYHLVLARDLEFLKRPEYDQLVELLVEIKKMLAAFLRKLKADR
jgi:four helix bundle protein